MPSNSNRSMMVDLDEPVIAILGQSSRHIDAWKRSNLIEVCNDAQLNTIVGLTFHRAIVLENAVKSWVRQQQIDYINQLDRSYGR